MWVDIEVDKEVDKEVDNGTPMSRPSPSVSAADSKVGLIMLGNDGHQYQVAKRKDKTHYWKKLAQYKIKHLARLTSDEEELYGELLGVVDEAGRIATKVNMKLPYYRVLISTRNKMYWFRMLSVGYSKLPPADKQIFIGELQTTRLDTRDLFGSIELPVTNAFYKILCEKPKQIKGKFGNAYIFGPLFKEMYILAGEHGNDVASTGIFDVTGLSKTQRNAAAKELDNYDLWKKYYPKWDYDSRSALAKIRKEIPRILFVGQTVGGDVGAGVYIHTTNNRIDSLIIDVFCLFVSEKTAPWTLKDEEILGFPMFLK